MSRLILVRHAQASFDKADYDQLSDLGHKQARALGDWLAELREVTHLYCGPLKRHRQTMERCLEELSLLGIEWPEPVFLDQLAEHKGPQVLKALMPKLVETDQQIQAWGKELENGQGSMRSVHLKVFDYVMREWAADRLEDDHLEYPSWADFVQMVEEGMEAMIRDSGPGATAVAFTSGGTMSAAVGYALGMSDPEKVIGLNGLVYNTGLSEFLYAPGRISLKSFNAVPHLKRKELLTYV